MQSIDNSVTMSQAATTACMYYSALVWVHAENSKVSVTDLSSTNGTYIEELVPLRAVEMSVGKEVTFGKGFGHFQLVPQLYRQTSF